MKIPKSLRKAFAATQGCDLSDIKVDILPDATFIVSAEIKAARNALKPKNLKIGQVMPDGTRYAGISPVTHKRMYAAPQDEPVTMSFNAAAQCAAQRSEQTGQAYRVPTIQELDCLYGSRDIIDGYLRSGKTGGNHWSSSLGPGAIGYSQDMGTGVQNIYIRDAKLYVRLIRS